MSAGGAAAGDIAQGLSAEGLCAGYGDAKVLSDLSLQVAPGDMTRLGLADGDRVRLTSDHGAVEVCVTPAKKDELPEGLLFIAYGNISSQLMGGDTHGSGMPTSKGLDVTLEVVKST